MNAKQHFLNLYRLAMCDGNFDESEYRTIQQIAQERGYSFQELNEMLTSPFGATKIIPSDFMERIELLYDFTRLIWADGVIEESERTTFLDICKKDFGFGSDESEELFDWLMLLAKQGLSPSDMKRKINELIQQ